MLQFDKHFPCCINGLKGMSSIETYLYYEILMIKKKLQLYEFYNDCLIYS